MFVDELDKYFADVGLYILTVGWIEPAYETSKILSF